MGTGKWWEQGCGGNRSNNAWLFIISNNAWLFIISLNLGFGQFILLSLAWLLTAGSYLPLVPILRPGSYSQIYHLQGISTGIYVNVSISIWIYISISIGIHYPFIEQFHSSISDIGPTSPHLVEGSWTGPETSKVRGSHSSKVVPFKASMRGGNFWPFFSGTHNESTYTCHTYTPWQGEVHPNYLSIPGWSKRW